MERNTNLVRKIYAFQIREKHNQRIHCSMTDDSLFEGDSKKAFALGALFLVWSRAY
jgi:hypothetical protein